jgi:hypothetical protein
MYKQLFPCWYTETFFVVVIYLFITCFCINLYAALAKNVFCVLVSGFFLEFIFVANQFFVNYQQFNTGISRTCVPFSINCLFTVPLH